MACQLRSSMRSSYRGLALAVSFQDALPGNFFPLSRSPWSLDSPTMESFAELIISSVFLSLQTELRVSEHFKDYISERGGGSSVISHPDLTYDLLLYAVPAPLALGYLRDASSCFPRLRFMPIVGVTPENYSSLLFDVE